MAIYYYEVFLKGTIKGTPWLMRWHYSVDSGIYTQNDVEGNWTQYLASFETKSLGEIKQYISNKVLFNLIEVKGISNPVFFNSRIPETHTGGTDVAELYSRFLTYTVRLNRSVAYGRHGYKRWPGVTTQLVVDGDFSAGPIPTDAIRYASWPILEATAFPSAVPVIRTSLWNGQEFLGYEYNPASSIAAPRLGTQNSRKS